MRREHDWQFDDGGTPAWRARQATILEASPPLTRPIAWGKAFIRRTSLPRLLAYVLLAAWALPMGLFFGGVFIMAALGINPG